MPLVAQSIATDNPTLGTKMAFKTGNNAADKLLDLLGEHFEVMPWFTDNGALEHITLVVRTEEEPEPHATTIKFVDIGEPAFVLNDEVIRGSI